MIYGVLYLLDSGTVGLSIFNAGSLQEAHMYIDCMVEEQGFSRVWGLRELENGVTVPELMQLFPRLTEVGLVEYTP